MGRESLNIPKFGLKILEMGRKSLGIPKFGHESLEMGRKSLCPCLCHHWLCLVPPFTPFPEPQGRANPPRS